jgi:N-acetyl-alpha-D-muramate 1-phosphate uridylyltransferase
MWCIKQMDIQVVILAGGMGTRLGNLTENRPKSLVEINGKPFLAYQLELLKNNGISDIVLCTGHLGAQIQEAFGDGSRYRVRLRYSPEEKPLGTAGALKNAESLLKDTFFVMYGDSYLFPDFEKTMSYFTSQKKLGLDTVFKNNDAYDKSNIAIKNNLVAKYSKVEKNKEMVYIDYGAAIFRKEALRLIPENRFSPLEDLFVRLIEMEQLLAYEVTERFYEIGSPQGLKDFEEFARHRLGR